MAKMTEQEAWELDEILTSTDPKTGINGTGFISRRDARILGLDDLSINYLMTKAQAAQKSPAQIIGELVREKIAASV
ncbi:MAG: hypothetical protein LBS67_03720 [Clostridiales Family XIII bacterium]|jgi:hypothetical protein|nr:hypothetical protein [Clostridiales Family XIII bacterium]